MWNLIPLPYKLIGAGALVALLVLAYRWHSNALVEQGRREGKQIQLKDDEDKLKKVQDEARKQLDQQAKVLAIAIETNDANRAQMRQIRTKMDADLDKTIAEIQRNQQVCDVNVDAVPDSELSDAIRAQLARLRAADRNGAAQSAGTP